MRRAEGSGLSRPALGGFAAAVVAGGRRRFGVAGQFLHEDIYSSLDQGGDNGSAQSGPALASRLQPALDYAASLRVQVADALLLALAVAGHTRSFGRGR